VQIACPTTEKLYFCEILRLNNAPNDNTTFVITGHIVADNVVVVLAHVFLLSPVPPHGFFVRRSGSNALLRAVTRGISDFLQKIGKNTPDFLRKTNENTPDFLQKHYLCRKTVHIMEKTYYPRTVDSYLLAWKNEKIHKPLLLRGARQVGKSSAIRQLGNTFKHFVEVNFERDKEIMSLFTGSLNPKEIASRLSAFYGIPVVPGDTLLFLDEIQACPEAIHALWFFYEDYPELHVVAAGSLLEFALRKMKSFGVGRVRSLFMYPMSFDEYLVATGKQAWVEAKQNASINAPVFDALHRKLVESFRSYLLIGGMPESVNNWIETGDYLKCRQVQDDIMLTYEDDFSKYEEKVDPMLLRQTLRSIAKQIGGKFIYANVQGNYRSEKVKEALELLKDAGLIKPVVHTAANGIPLGAEINDKFVKYIFLDSGLLLRLLGLENVGGTSEIFKLIFAGTESDLVNKGHITEMVAGLELLKYSTPTQRHDLYYWQNLSRGAQAEVDYVMIKNMKVVPLEVKAGTTGSMKSMYQFIEAKHLDYGIRTSLENFSKLGNVDIIPLYALSNIYMASTN
jgi:predicted AAA+ superfamily ATPase